MMHSLVKNLQNKSKKRIRFKREKKPTKERQPEVSEPNQRIPEANATISNEENPYLKLKDNDGYSDSDAVVENYESKEEVVHDTNVHDEPKPPEQQFPPTEASPKNLAKQPTTPDDDGINEDVKEEEEHEMENIPTHDRIDNIDDNIELRQLLGLTIQRTDRLKTKIYISHPKVTVQIVDADSGQYIKASNRFRGMAGLDSKTNDIKIMSTRDFNLLESNDSFPEWNELLLLPVEVSRLNDLSTRALLLFRVLAKNGMSNIGRKMRLQLYRAPKKSRIGAEDEKEVFYWWRTSNRRIKYPSTLHIKTKAILPNAQSNPLSRVPSGSLKNLQNESSQDLARSVEDLNNRPEDGLEKPIEEETVVWSKYPSEPFRVPKEKFLTISRSRFGSISVKFSPNGRWLGCATQGVLSYPVNIHAIPSGRLYATLNGHLQLVYGISWKWDSTMIITTSADCTARIWKTASGICVQVLAHSTFVYAGEFHPLDDNCVLTGAMDKTIRLWKITSGLEAVLIQEILEHRGSVNCLFISSDRKRLISGDSSGVIKIWACAMIPSTKEDAASQPCLQFIRNVHNDELNGSVINNVILTNDNRILLVVRREYDIIAIDLRSSAIKYRMHVQIDSLHIRADCSPDGRWLYCGNLSGQLGVYDMNNGTKVFEYVDVQETEKVAVSVSVHPVDHMIAIGYIGDSSPVVLYKRNPNNDKDDELQKPNKNETPQVFDINSDIKALLENHRLISANHKIQEIFKEAALKK